MDSLGKRRWLKTSEAAEILGITTDAVRKAIRDERLEAVDLNAGSGRKPRYRITVRALRDYVGGR